MGYTFPIVRDAIDEALDGGTFASVPVTTYKHLTVDFAETLPAVQIIDFGGVEAFIERTDRVGVDVYAEGEKAGQVAEAIKSWLVDNHDVGGITVDAWAVEITPHDVPYASDRVNLCSAVYRATTRPV